MRKILAALITPDPDRPGHVYIQNHCMEIPDDLQEPVSEFVYKITGKKVYCWTWDE